MQIGVYDVDGVIPNLALMKISAWHKTRGDSVSHYNPILKNEYDKIYASKTFLYSDGSKLDPEKMEIGGTGWDIHKTLPPEIESMPPDYALYHYPHSIGFTMRGCRLRCSFCVVPDKEGAPKPTSTVSEIWQQRSSDFIMLLDNDFFGNPQWRERVLEIQAHNLRVNFSQGINIRNLKPEQAEALAGVRYRNSSGNKQQIHFAWDDVRHEKLIHKGIETAINAGIKPYRMAFYILIGYSSSPAEDLHRVLTLRDYGCDPFVMPYDRGDAYQRKFARWVNHKAIFRSVSWDEYSDGIKTKKIDTNQINMFNVI